MKVLVACECSQVVTNEFRKKGHEAYSCDISFPRINPDWHIKDDVLNHLDENWDLIIAHPPCTYLSNAGACRLYDKNHNIKDYDRYLKGIAASEFFMKLYNAPCQKICIENPIPMKIFNLPQYSQIINPCDFGHPFSKRTCLWLKNLDLLFPTVIGVNAKSWVFTERSQYMRSKTFENIAACMANTWG